MDATEAARQLNALRPRAEAICAHCGEAFRTYAQAGGRFCSGRCRKAVWTAKHREQERDRVRAYRARKKGGTPLTGVRHSRDNRGTADLRAQGGSMFGRLGDGGGY